MADALHIVSRDEQDQYVHLLNLEEAGVIFKQRDTLKITLGAREPVYATSERRRGGAVQVSESRGLASVAATFMVKGLTSDEAIENLEDLLAESDAAGERWLWWEPEGASRVSLYPIVGPAQCSVNYTWPMLMSGFFPCEVVWPTQPWTDGLVQDFSDDFRDRGWVNESLLVPRSELVPTSLLMPGGPTTMQMIGDYTTDVTPASVAQGALEMPASLAGTSAVKVVHLRREPWQDGWVVAKGKAKTGSSSVSTILSPGLRYTPLDGKYFFAQQTATTLSVQEFDGAVINTRATAAMVGPAVGTSFWMRCRAEGESVTAEFWTTNPTPTGTPTATCTYTNAAAVRTGYPVLQGRGTAAGNTQIIEEFESRPYSYRLQNTPTTINVEPLPGTMDAPADVDLAHATSDPDWPRHVLLGWRRRLAGYAGGSSMLLPGEGCTALAGGSTTPVLATDAARYRGASNQAMTIPVLATAGTTSIIAAIDPTIYEADAFRSTVTCAVIVRYYRQSGIIAPRLAASIAVSGGSAFGYTPEFGSTGRFLPGATATARVTTTTLGTVTVTRQPQGEALVISLSWAAGSTAAQVLGVDEIYLVPVASLAMSPTDKGRDDGTYPALAAGTGTEARIGSDGRGARRQPGSPLDLFSPVPLGIGGADINLPVASEGVELLVRPSASVPDDPVYLTTADTLTHNVSVHLRVTPRYRFAA